MGNPLLAAGIEALSDADPDPEDSLATSVKEPTDEEETEKLETSRFETAAEKSNEEDSAEYIRVEEMYCKVLRVLDAAPIVKLGESSDASLIMRLCDGLDRVSDILSGE